MLLVALDSSQIFTNSLQTKQSCKSHSLPFNTLDETRLILNSVRSVTHHLETTAGFLPEALAADRALGSQILRLILVFHKPVKSAVSCSPPSAPKRTLTLRFLKCKRFTSLFFCFGHAEGISLPVHGIL